MRYNKGRKEKQQKGEEKRDKKRWRKKKRNGKEKKKEGRGKGEEEIRGQKKKCERKMCDRLQP